MPEYNQPCGKGSISANQTRDSDKHPSHRGSLLIEEDIRAGTKLWIAGWANEDRESGRKYLSIKVTKAQASSGQRFGGGGESRGGGGGHSSGRGGYGGNSRSSAPERPRREEMDDEIPF